ncbi:hypothetical protein [Intrasporangium sp. DVR]|uniref:hypothetical protein n=1 Tax=Intrasporangium sp. DVR TaxID=3127867 RepID=UPI00313A63F9
MSTPYPSQHVRPLRSAEEAMVRDLLPDRVDQPSSPRPVRRHVRTALVLRRLAARLDPEAVATVGTTVCPEATRRLPRPWSAGPRRASGAH